VIAPQHSSWRGFHVPLLVAWLSLDKGFAMSHYTPMHLLVQAYHPISFSDFRCVVLSASVSSFGVAVLAVQGAPVEVAAMEMCNRHSV
jgi:hypothetical protein